MAETPIVHWLLGHGHEVGTDSIYLDLGIDGQRKFRIDISAKVVPAMIGLLAAECVALYKGRESDAAEGTLLNVTGISGAISDQPHPMILLHLSGGLELPLQFQGGSIDELIELLRLAKASAAGPIQ